MQRIESILIVGAGIFGVSAALELARRGFRVVLLDRGPIPHPHASSTDVCKAVRMDYGADQVFTQLMEKALVGWRKWNVAWREKIFREDGVLFATRQRMARGSFEHESFVLLEDRGHRVERLAPEALRARFPAWVPTGFEDGYFNPQGGWVDSAAAVGRLLQEARGLGVEVRAGAPVSALLQEAGRTTGVVLEGGETWRGDRTIIAAGAWTPTLLPEIRGLVSVLAQPVLHFRPLDPNPFRTPLLVTWAADVSTTGWYGFPLLPDGTVKVGHHGPGRPVSPDDRGVVGSGHESKCRKFLRATLPALAAAPVVRSRNCLYCDSWDGAFYIDHVPGRPGAFVATGGSGHAFKFAPCLGTLIADAVERLPNPFLRRFAWRSRRSGATDQARSES